MKDDIRKKTVLIIQRGAEYLVGTVCYSKDLKWSTSPWDAWSTRDREKAWMVARKVGGETVLFNPVAGQIGRRGDAPVRDVQKEGRVPGKMQAESGLYPAYETAEQKDQERRA